jgi:hypothetical protein
MNMLGLSSSVHFTHIACYRKMFASALRTSPMSVQAFSIQFNITLLLTVSQSISLGIESYLGLMTRYLLPFDSYSLAFWGALSDERTGLSFVYADGPHHRIISRVRVPWDS